MHCACKFDGALERGSCPEEGEGGAERVAACKVREIDFAFAGRASETHSQRGAGWDCWSGSCANDEWKMRKLGEEEGEG